MGSKEVSKEGIQVTTQICRSGAHQKKMGEDEGEKSRGIFLQEQSTGYKAKLKL